MSLPEAVFAGSVLLVFHAYLGYPLTLSAIGLFRRKAVRKGECEPRVTLIIAVYNEEK